MLSSYQIAILNFIIRFITLIIVYPFTDMIEKRVSVKSMKNLKAEGEL